MRLLLILLLLASLLGFAFAAVSTYDSVAHLDRQVHGVHCSYLVGVGQKDASGSSGCYATLMSPYSSVLRESIWGGVPVSLAGMSVFCFIFFWGMWLLLGKRLHDPYAVGFLFASTALPFLSSAIMGYLSIVTLNTKCQLCMGIYGASTVAFFAAGALFFTLRKHASGDFQKDDDERRLQPIRLSFATLCLAFCLGVLFVAVPFITYAAIAPEFSAYIGNCGSITHPQDPQGVLVPIGSQESDTEIIEVLDPLCGACGIFERRFESMPESAVVSRKLLLFPLDNACNWMVDEAIHPGACVISEAVLCAGTDARQVLNWAIDKQEAILKATKHNPNAAARMVTQRFPNLGRCIGGTAVRARLNLALRWAVKNQLQVLTPQIYVEGLRLCDEDTDLGLDYALPRLIARAQSAPPRREVSPPQKDVKMRRKQSFIPKVKAPIKKTDTGQTAEMEKSPEPGHESAKIPDTPKDRLDKLIDKAKARIDGLNPNIGIDPIQVSPSENEAVEKTPPKVEVPGATPQAMPQAPNQGGSDAKDPEEAP